MTDAIKRLKLPMNIINLNQFLGICNVCCRFVFNIACIPVPLNQKLKMDRPTHLGALLADEVEAMHELYDKLVSAPILALAFAEASYTLDTDACNVQVVCALLEEQPDGTTQPAGY